MPCSRCTEKPSFPKSFPWNQLKPRQTHWDMSPQSSLLSIFFFVRYKWSCFVLSPIQSPQKLMKTFPIAFQGFGPGPWSGWTHALVTVYIHITIKCNKTKPTRINSMSSLYMWILLTILKLKGCAFPCYKNSSGRKVKICSTCPEPTCFCCPQGERCGYPSSARHGPWLLQFPPASPSQAAFPGNT